MGTASRAALISPLPADRKVYLNSSRFSANTDAAAVHATVAAR